MKNVLSILKGELIGRNTNAVHLQHGNTFEGRIIDETKNTIVIKTDKGNKKLIKDLYAFEFAYENKRIRIEGRHFLKKPTDRIKTRLSEDG